MANHQIQGFWRKTWLPEEKVPSDSTLSVAFSGWVDPDKALKDSEAVKNQLRGEKYISLGGGTKEGFWTGKDLDKIINAITQGRFSEYQGIAFDIEEGDEGLANKFREAFVATKDKNLKVLVTVSHSAPYGIDDAKTLMNAFFADANIDYISPQLYTMGDETENNFDEGPGVSWTDYSVSIATIIPSIVQPNMYENARDYFKNLGINTIGYIQWAQTSSTAITISVENYANVLLKAVQNEKQLADLPAGSATKPSSTSVPIDSNVDLYILDPSTGSQWNMVCKVPAGTLKNDSIVKNNVPWGQSCNIA